VKAIAIVVGARPNFMKAAPLVRALSSYEDFHVQLVHTGQHYDPQLSEVFFRGLGVSPDVRLSHPSLPPMGQFGALTSSLWKFFEDSKPDLVVVVGDVNSTAAGAIAAAHLKIPVAHVEAGLRSHDWTMPEEINRRMTDSISTILFATDQLAMRNLHAEGHPEWRTRFVGNVMIDSLMHQMKDLKPSKAAVSIGSSSMASQTVLCTLHRPANVDDPKVLERIVGAISEAAYRHQLFVVFPLHPRTAPSFKALPTACHRAFLEYPPLPYDDVLYLMEHVRMVVTDSGGMQEETSFLGVPCVTVRANTERPVTCKLGTNILAGTLTSGINNAINLAMTMPRRKKTKIPLWDGKAAERIAKEIDHFFKGEMV
jgi:UDP-N-acetylglucosamine 2-epimerase (non-hydrolysing)